MPWVVSLVLAGVVAMPLDVRSEPAYAPEPLPRKHTLFLDFGGGTLTWVPTPEDENAAEDTSFMARFEVA